MTDTKDDAPVRAFQNTIPEGEWLAFRDSQIRRLSARFDELCDEFESL